MAFCASASATFLGRAIVHGHVPALKKPLLTSFRDNSAMAPALHNKRIAEFVALSHSPIDQSVCRRLGG
jgi:hypothetical protein